MIENPLISTRELGERMQKVAERINDLNRFSAAGEIDAEYLTPLEDVFEQIDEIVNKDTFVARYDPYDDTYKCHHCYGIHEIYPQEIRHNDWCKFKKLQDLVSTLGDMIS